MTLVEFLGRLDEAGIALRLDADNKLAIEMTAGALSDDDLAYLRENRAEVIRLLRQLDDKPAESFFPAVRPAPAHKHEPFPLSDIQEAYLVGRKGIVDGNPVATHYYGEFQGDNLDIGRLEGAFNALIARHEMLRAVFTGDGQQKILAQTPAYVIVCHDLRTMDEASGSEALEATRSRMSHQIKDEKAWPLFDVELSLLTGDRVRIHISVDLLIADFFSLLLLLKEWSDLYRNPESAGPRPIFSFRDYILAEHQIEETELYARSRAYWMDRTGSLPASPSLPQQVSAEKAGAVAFTRHAGRLSPVVWGRLKQWCKTNSVAPSGLLLAAFGEVLSKWSNSDHFSLAITIFNRLMLHADVENLVGDFTSSLLFEYQRDKRRSVVDQIRAVQQQLWEDIDHKYFSGVRLVRELNRMDKKQTHRFPVVFTCALSSDFVDEADQSWEFLGEEVFGISQTPQVFLDHVVTERGGALCFHWDVRRNTYPDGMIEAMFDAYIDILNGLGADDETFDFQVMLPPAACAETETHGAAVGNSGPADSQFLHKLVLETAKSRPEVEAVVCEGVGYSYATLVARAAGIAEMLVASGVAPRDIVGVHTDNRFEQIYCALGIQMAGAAYLPLDTQWPTQRIKEILGVAGARTLLTSNPDSNLLASQDRTALLLIEQGNDAAAPGHAERLADISVNDLAYVIFTSGSTGQPKGVMIEHAAAVNTVLDINERFAITAHDRVLAISNFNFDLSVYDIFGVLAAGGTVVTVDYDRLRTPQPAFWRELIARHQITVWNSVPALMQLMVDAIGDESCPDLKSLRVVMLSGDWVPLGLAPAVKALAPDATVYSLGGATEASIWSIFFEIRDIDASWRSIPYGRALSNQNIMVLDRDRKPCPIHVPGEIYISGRGLARGYIGRDDLTATSFILDETLGERLYRTGDWGCVMPCGSVEFLGRRDTQVKVGGHRIELNEIEAKLSRLPDVQACAVIALQDKNGGRRLAAVWVEDREGKTTSKDLRLKLGQLLPSYMVPPVFQRIDALPLTANGKVDRGRITAMLAEMRNSCLTVDVPARGGLEKIIIGLICKETSLSAVNPETNFFELGMSSLELVHVLARLEERVGHSVDPVLAFSNPTVRQLANALSEPNDVRQSQLEIQEIMDARRKVRAQRKAKFHDRRKA